MKNTALPFRDAKIQQLLDKFYVDNGPCCAGCDRWRWHNSVVGECIKSAPVAGHERMEMLGFQALSLTVGAGHVMTPRDHVCGDFLDTP